MTYPVQIYAPQSPSHLGALPSEQVRKDGRAVALLAPGHTLLSYRRLISQIEAVATQLNALGLRRGDRVALVLPNEPEMGGAFLAVASCATAVPLNPAYGEREIGFYLADLEAKAVNAPSEPDGASVTVAQ